LEILAEKCPICKRKLEIIFNELDDIDGHQCPNGHYVFSDSCGINGGFLIRIGKRVMDNLCSGSIRQCRLQNVIVDNWIKRERKKLNKM
jgi:hypothetical protein